MNNKTKSLASLIWIVFVDSMGWGIAFSVFAALFLSGHPTLLPASASDASRYMTYEFLLAIYSIFMFFFAPVLGGIADQYGRKPALNISMLGLTLGFILCTLGCYWSNIWLLMLGRIVSGITAGSLSVAQAAAVDISTPEKKSFYLSILMMANALGFSLGPILGGVFMMYGSAPIGTTTFLIATIMSIIGFLSIYFFFEETFVPAPTNKKLNLVKDFLNIKIAFCKPILGHYLSVILFSMLAFGLFYSNIPVFISRQFMENSSATGGVLSSGAIIFSLTLMFGGKYIFNYCSKTSVVFLTLLLQCCAYTLLALGIPSFVLNVVLFICISALAGLMYIALLTLVSDVTESDWQGRVMGVVAALSSVTWGVGPLLTGALNRFNAGVAFIFTALLIVLSLVALHRSNIKRIHLQYGINRV